MASNALDALAAGQANLLTDEQLRASAVPISAAALPLPSGAATGAKQDAGNTTLASIDGKLANPLPVSGPVTDVQLRAVPLPISGTVAATGPLTDAQLRAAAVPVSAASLPLPTDAATEVTLALIKAKTDNLDVALSTRAVTGLTDVQLRASAVPVKELRAATPAVTSVSVASTNTVILASNANRLGATIYNESGAIAYVKLGATATVTSYTVQIVIGGYYEAPYGYTGAIDGITASGTAVVRVTELT